MSSFKDKIASSLGNPAMIKHVMLDKIAEGQPDVEISDMTNPLSYLMEATATIGSALDDSLLSVSRKWYPKLAQSMDDLYGHMSDNDFIGLFAMPGSATVGMMFRYQDIKSKAVYDLSTGVGKIVIPKYTKITAVGYPLCIHYPIEIKILPNDTVQVTYITDTKSGMQVLDSNILETNDYLSTNGDLNLIIHIPVEQLERSSYSYTLNKSTGFKEIIAIKDEFYHIEAFHVNKLGNREQIRTTHSEMVHESKVPTLFCKLVDGGIEVHVPEIYFTLDNIGSEVRIDVYTSKGYVNIDLSEYTSETYAVTWESLDDNTYSKYHAPLYDMEVGVVSNGLLEGGRKALSFQDRLELVLNASSGTDTVSNEGLTNKLAAMGYTAYLYEDTVTDRRFNVTKTLPAPQNGTSISPIGAVMAETHLDYSELDEISTVAKKDGNRTILPNSLFRYVNGSIFLLTDAEREAINSLPIEQVVSEYNNNQYLYTPFHYSLRNDDEYFTARPYYLDSPEYIGKQFSQTNLNTTKVFASDNYGIVRKDYGYRLYVSVVVDDVLKEHPDKLGLQFSFTDLSGVTSFSNAYYSHANEETGDLIFYLDLTTDYEIDRNDQISLTNFKTKPTDLQSYYAPLEVEFDVITWVDDLIDPTEGFYDIDKLLRGSLIPKDAAGIRHEKVTFKLGEHVETLKCNSRTVTASEVYETYDEDIPWLYETDVLEHTAAGYLKFVEDGEGGYKTVTLHSAGDPVLDVHGEPTIRYKKGDPKIVDGSPVVAGEGGVVHVVDLLCLDGKYVVCNDEYSTAYATSIPKLITKYSNDDIAPMEGELFEGTELQLEIKSSIGNVRALVASNYIVDLPSSLDFDVEIFITDIGYRDGKLRSSIEDTITNIISEVVEQDRISVDDIQDRIKLATDDTVLAVKVSPLGGDLELPLFSIVGLDATCNVNKRLELLSDNSVELKDSINIQFTKH